MDGAIPHSSAYRVWHIVEPVKWITIKDFSTKVFFEDLRLLPIVYDMISFVRFSPSNVL